MNKVCLKQDIFIEGFDSNQRLISNQYLLANNIKLVLYSGKTSEIPEELARECISFIDNPMDNGRNIPFKNYSHNFLGVTTDKESIQSACSQEFCIIYKTN